MLHIVCRAQLNRKTAMTKMMMMMMMLVTMVKEMSTGKMGGNNTKRQKNNGYKGVRANDVKAKRMGKRQSASNMKIFRKFNGHKCREPMCCYCIFLFYLCVLAKREFLFFHCVPTMFISIETWHSTITFRFV